MKAPIKRTVTVDPTTGSKTKQKIDYNAINFKNKDVDKFSTRFGNGDPVKGQGPQKVDYGKKLMEIDKPSATSVNIRSTNNTLASDKTSVKTSPKPTGPSKPSWQLAASQRQVQNDRQVDKLIAENQKQKAAKKAAEEQARKERDAAFKKKEQERANRIKNHANK
jgi:hypothetical protein